MDLLKKEYLTMILLIERLHRRFLDVVKAELDNMHIEDINNVQTLILYNIADENLTVGELTNRGYYLGSNVSYNIKKLVESDFIIQERSAHDKRSVKVKLSEKGKQLTQRIDAMYERDIRDLKERGLDEIVIEKTLDSLTKLEDYWSDSINPRNKF